MNFSNITFKADGGIGVLTIDRPKALNALNAQTIMEIQSVLTQIRETGDINVLILTGAGEKAFVAGADINEIEPLGLKDGFDFLQKGHRLNHDIESLGIPTIAAVNGLALGGGCELALACTLRIVAENAMFGLPELGLGVIPGYGGTQRLARMIGKGPALWYLLTGEMMNAAKALDFHIANMVVPQAELIEHTRKVAGKIKAKAPLAVKMALYAVHYGLETDLETGLVLESALANLTIASEDKREGITAFLEKRKPSFKGV